MVHNYWVLVIELPTRILLFDHAMLTKYFFVHDSISANYLYEIMTIGTLQKKCVPQLFGAIMVFVNGTLQEIKE